MLHEFINYLTAIRGYSENTARAYRNDLRTFIEWAKENVKDPRWSTFTRDHIDAFLQHQHAAGLKPSTTNRQIAAISSLYHYMQRNNLAVVNPCQYESRRKLPQTQPTTIPVEQLRKAYERAQGTPKTMLGLLASTGIRIQELLDLTWGDIDFNDATLKIHGKGSKERTVHTFHQVLDTLRPYSSTAKPEQRVFWCSQRKARYIIEEALKPYCNSPHLNPHTIRHTYATELAKNGESTATIAKILGHTHLETSQKYIDLAKVPTSTRGICLT